jgi:predicted PurR-regulated permease PerM
MNGDRKTAARLNQLLAFMAVIAILYFGREFFLPLVLAILISFLLAPLIRRFEGWKMGRVFAVIVATLLSLSAIGCVGYVITGQLLDLANELPKYKTNLQAKIASLKMSPNSPVAQATRTLQELTADLATPESSPAASGAAPASPEAKAAETGAKGAPAVPVEVVDRSENAFELFGRLVGPLIGPLGNAAVVIVFVVFMLIGREDLRDRIIHLVGKQRLYLTTQALDDAAHRVSRYLLAQLIVNVTYGIPVGIGLYFIGIPNAVLWGLIATIVRFIPYIGPWIGAMFPLALSLAVSPSWNAPLLVLGLIVVLELISNNVVEPWLYGASTGLSPMAVIVSAVFWTWLWGTLGLLLATPLTVCLAVLGKYIPALGFLDVLLGDKPPIATSDRFYQRLLAGDEEEVFGLAEKHCEEASLVSAYENVVLPAVCLTEADFKAGEMTEETRHNVYQLVRRLILDLGEPYTPPARNESGQAQVLCLPACCEGDELVAMMLGQLLERSGVSTRVISSKSLASEMTELAGESCSPFVCVSSVPPTSVVAAAYLCKRLRARLTKVRLSVGIWHESEADIPRRRERLDRVKVDDIFFTLEKAATELALTAGLENPPLLKSEPRTGAGRTEPELTSETVSMQSP